MIIFVVSVIAIILLVLLGRKLRKKYQKYQEQKLVIIKKRQYDRLTADLSSYLEYRLKEARPQSHTISISTLGRDKVRRNKRPKITKAIAAAKR